jgi:hypothetical protein
MARTHAINSKGVPDEDGYRKRKGQWTKSLTVVALAQLNICFDLGVNGSVNRGATEIRSLSSILRKEMSGPEEFTAEVGIL